MTGAGHLVLGGGGFLGRHLVRALARDRERVTAVGRSFPAPAPAGVETRRLDLYALDDAALTALVAGHAVVHHLAWSTVPATAQADPAADLRDNVGFTRRLTAATAATGARLVFASSGGTVYGRAGAQPIPETHPLAPIGAYGVGKAAAEGVLREALAAGLDARIARMSNAFGAGQSRDRPQGALSRFAADAVAGRPLSLWGDGEVVRDHLHVSDAVEGWMRLVHAPRGAIGFDPVLNLGSGEGCSLNRLIALLEDLLGRPLAVERRPGRPYDVPVNVLDIGRAAERLGWRPALSLPDGVARMLEDLRADPDALYSGGPQGG